MEIKLGMIVKSVYGHDSNRFYVVVRLEGKFAFIVDGKTRKLEKPKRKNVKHLNKTNELVNVLEMDSNNKIRRALWSYNNEPAVTARGGNLLV
jgi:ribosomal protein L14E/L6E/L27E